MSPEEIKRRARANAIPGGTATGMQVDPRGPVTRTAQTPAVQPPLGARVAESLKSRIASGIEGLANVSNFMTAPARAVGNEISQFAGDFGKEYFNIQPQRPNIGSVNPGGLDGPAGDSPPPTGPTQPAAALPQRPPYAVGGNSQATPLEGPAAQQAISQFDAQPTPGSGYITMGGKTVMINPRTPGAETGIAANLPGTNGAPSGVTPADYQAAVARAQADKQALAKIEGDRSREALMRTATTPTLGSISEMAAGRLARQGARAELGRLNQQEQATQQQAFQQPLRQAQIGKLQQDIATGAQKAAERVQIMNLRQKIMNAKTPEERKKYEAQLFAIQGKPPSKYQIVTEDTFENGVPVKKSYIVEPDEQGNPLTRPITGLAAQGGPQGTPKKISTQSEFNALPSGATYIGDDGRTYRKP